jgi:hypothetical protein
MRRIKRSALIGILLGSLAGLAQTAAAQGDMTAPQPAALAQPPQPTNGAGTSVDGWAIVRYSVLADGTTDNVHVIETVPPGIETGPTIESVGQWTFTPGTRDGEAIDWHNTESLITYRAEGASQAPSSEFQSQFDAIRVMLEGEPPIDLEAAMRMNRALLEESATQMTELAITLAQRALIALALNDAHAAYESLLLATDPRLSAMTGDDLFFALQLRLQLADQLGRSQDVIETHERLAAMFDPEQEDPLAEHIAQLRDIRTNDETLQVLGYVDDDPWRISADRRIFTIDEVDGVVDGIDVECDARRTTLDYQPGVEWQLPESWGNCELFVAGDPGTSFSFFAFLAPAE